MKPLKEKVSSTVDDRSDDSFRMAWTHGLNELRGKMKRPVLNEIQLDISGLIARKGLIVTMSIGQWDGLLEAAYDSGAVLLELDDNEIPIKAYRRKSDADG